MKKLIFLALILTTAATFADEKTNSKDEWHNTTLSDETIKNIQQTKYVYKDCIAKEAQQPTYVKMDVRAATDKILMQCEKSLADMRKVFTDEQVPSVIIDRYLKQTRTQMARKLLKEMMFAEAARQSGQ